MAKHKIGIIGFGKIAQDQHVPAIKANPAFELIAVASQRGLRADEAEHAFTDYREMLNLRELDAVAICTPPGPRHAIARDALRAGKHVLLEKPPAATLCELADLEQEATVAGRTLFATWHAQYNAGVEEARKALSGRQVTRMAVTWKEDVRRWHPGQSWIWEAGGFGVFDPGINALSIVTRIVPAPVFVRRADLEFPSNKDAPIAARLEFSSGGKDEHLSAAFDWRQTGEQTWAVEIETSDGLKTRLSKGGSRLEIDGRFVVEEPMAEYPAIYRRFDELLRNGQSEVDTHPFRLVADAFMVGRRLIVDAFSDDTQ
jgi:D-galactose 1-dehydrogenase